MKLLPIQPKPREDELLSSWMTRLAIENTFFTHPFYTQVIDQSDGAILLRDLDRLDSPELINLLSRVTLFSKESIESLKLSSFIGNLYTYLNANGNSRWILPLGKYHRKIIRNGVVFCPLCLKEDSVRYFRKSWRLSFITICYKHRCMMNDECSFCHSAIDYLRHGIGSRKFILPNQDLGRCFNCGNRLSDTPVNYLDYDYDLFLTNYLDFLSRFHSKQPLIPSLNQSLNIQVLDGLWFLCGRLMSSRAEQVRKRIFNQTGLELKEQKISIDYLSLKERMDYLIATLYYLEDWPEKFLKLVKGAKFTQTLFSDCLPSTPFWLHSIITTKLNNSIYSISNEELANARKYLLKRSIVPNPRTLSKLLGPDASTISLRLESMGLTIESSNNI